MKIGEVSLKPEQPEDSGASTRLTITHVPLALPAATEDPPSPVVAIPWRQRENPDFHLGWVGAD